MNEKRATTAGLDKAVHRYSALSRQGLRERLFTNLFQGLEQGAAHHFQSQLAVELGQLGIADVFSRVEWLSLHRPCRPPPPSAALFSPKSHVAL